MLFIDSGAFIARYIEKDQHHALALASWTKAAKQGRLFTSNYVIDETLTYLGRRTDYEFAASRGRAIYGSTQLEILRPDEEDEYAALDFFEKLADQKVSFTDCVSFALMRRHRLKRAFTYDRHFEAAGFAVWG